MDVLAQTFDPAARAWDYGWSVGLLVTVLVFVAAMIVLWVRNVEIPRHKRSDAREEAVTARQLSFFDSLEKAADDHSSVLKHIAAGMVVLESGIGKLKSMSETIWAKHDIYLTGCFANSERLTDAARILLECARDELGTTRPTITAAIDRALWQLEHEHAHDVRPKPRKSEPRG